MSGAAKRPTRRRLRCFLATLASLLLLAITAALVLPWWFDARRVAGLVLERASATTGLDWSIAGEPALRWRPDAWLALPGLTVRDAEGRTLLQATRLEVAVPWSTLRGEETRIGAIRLESPRVDADAVMAWWQAQAAGADTALPVLEGLELVDGQVHWEGGTVSAMQWRTSRVSAGEALDVQWSGKVVLDDGGPEAFDVRLSLVGQLEAAPLRLKTLQLELAGNGPVPALNAHGRLQTDPWTIELTGALAAWPDAWPALPPPIGDTSTPLTFEFTQTGADAMSAPARLQLNRPGAALDVTGVPADLLAWSRDDSASPLPPMLGRAEMPLLELDGVPMEGVSLEVTEIDEEQP